MNTSKIYWIGVLVFWLVSLSAWIVTPESIVLNGTLLVIGVVLIFAKLFWSYKSTRVIFKELNILKVLGMLLSFFLFISIWSLSNFLFHKKPVVVYSHDIAVAQLSEQTKALLDQVDTATITLLTKRERWEYFLPILRKVKSYNPQIEYQAFDLDLNPSLIQKYKLTGIDALVLETPNKKVTTYFNPKKKIEMSLVNALLRLTQENPLEISFSQGHGEFQITDEGNQGLSFLRDKLEEQSFIVNTVDLSKSEIALQTSLLVLWGSKRRFEISEVQKIINFLERGGQVFIAQGPVFGSDAFSSLRDLLKLWDLSLENRILLDKLSSSKGMEPTIITAQSVNKTHPVMKSFDKKQIYLPLSSPIIITQNHGNKRALSMLSSESFPAVWGESNLQGVLQGQASFDQDIDTKGPFVVMASSQQTDGNLGGVVLAASSSFALNNYSAQTSHFQLILNTISWQLGLDHLVLNKRLADKREPIILSQKHIYFIFYIAVLLLPILGMFSAFYFFMRKKNL